LPGMHAARLIQYVIKFDCVAWYQNLRNNTNTKRESFCPVIFDLFHLVFTPNHSPTVLYFFPILLNQEKIYPN
jgi:hypothetical protein